MKQFLLIALLAFGFAFISVNVQAQTSTSSSTISGPTSQQVHLPTADLPMSLVYRVLYQAQVPLSTPFQVLMSEYYNKDCKVTCIAIQQNGDMTFLVEYGGGSALIDLQGSD